MSRAVRVVPVRTPTLPPATHTNCYVLDGRTVVDPASPWAEEQERLAAELEGEPLERIVLTHHHLDHVSGAVDLARRRGLPIAAHPLTAQLVDFDVDILLNEGDTLHGWELLHTPGHAAGHLCFLRDGEMVCGDMVAGVGTILIEPGEGDLATYLASLERMTSYGPFRLWPAHGPAMDAGVDKLWEYIAHRNKRTEQVRAALSKGPGTPIELVAQVYGDTIPKFVYPLAARQLQCHLEWLAATGEAHLEGEHWHA